MSVEELIAEMQEVKANYPTLDIPDILRLFNIDALRELTKVLWGTAKR